MRFEVAQHLPADAQHTQGRCHGNHVRWKEPSVLVQANGSHRALAPAASNLSFSNDCKKHISFSITLHQHTPTDASSKPQYLLASSFHRSETL